VSDEHVAVVLFLFIFLSTAASAGSLELEVFTAAVKHAENIRAWVGRQYAHLLLNWDSPLDISGVGCVAHHLGVVVHDTMACIIDEDKRVGTIGLELCDALAIDLL